MDERLRFVARLLDGEKMAVLCREFEISRKTGYKIFSRYKDCGVDGLTDRSRRPYRHARQLPFQVEKAILQLKREHPSWGLRRSVNGCAGNTLRCTVRRSVPFMRSSIATAWSGEGGDASTGLKARLSLALTRLTIFGALITRASSCWQTVATVTR
jgi:hypothetical protein